MKVLITGGHLSPAASLIERAPSDWEIFFVGRKSSFEGENTDSLEYQTVSSLDIPFFSLPSSRLQRRFTRHTLPSLAKIPFVVFKSISILRKTKPDVVVGFGGYVSLPVCIAARFLNIPVVIHEQTSEAGAANKIISKWAKKVCISWQSSFDFFPKEKTTLTGNPLRTAIIKAKNHEKTDKKVIFVTGGSAGAHFINKLIGDSLIPLLEKYYIVHQVGDSRKFNDFEYLHGLKRQLPEGLSEKYVLTKFIPLSEIGKIMQLSTIVVGRAGVNTVSELLYLEKPSLLIPLPFSQKNEQLKNANFLKEMGLAQVLFQDSATPDRFISLIDSMMEEIEKYKVNIQAEVLLTEDSVIKLIKVIQDVSSKSK